MPELSPSNAAALQELADLLERVAEREDHFARAETFYLTHCDDWSPGLCACYRDMLERKLDQLHYEWYRIRKMGMDFATGKFDAPTQTPGDPE